MLKNAPFVFILSLYFFHAAGQTRIIIHENTTQHEQDKNTKARRNKGTIKDGASNFFSSSESAVKLNILSIVRSDYCISYEKKITPLFSAEVTGGVTYNDQFFDGVADFQNYRPYNMTNSKRQHSIGPSVKAALRYYFDADDQEIAGPYAGVEGMFRRYSTTVMPHYTLSPVKEFNDHREIRTFLGWQGSDWSDVAFYDFSIGVGYRAHVRNYVGYADNTYSTDQLMLGQKNYLTFFFNLKIGFLLDY
jgi:hypothetical protein